MAQFVENRLHFSRPNKRLRLLILDANELKNSGDQFWNAAEDAAFYPFAREFSEPAFD